MADHRHHQHRPHRLSVPPRTATTFTTTPRHYPTFPYSSSTPTPTPSKTRLSSVSSLNSKSKSSLSFLFLLLFSLRSLYSLLPFLRSSPSFSLFPFSFLVSLLSFFLTLSFSLFSSPSSSNDPFLQHKTKKQPLFALSSITHSQQRVLVAKSVLLALVFLLRFQALRYCGTAAMILAELMGSIAAARFVERRNQNRNRWHNKVRGFVTLFLGLFLLSFGWDRVECFPLSSSSDGKWGKPVFPSGDCVSFWPMLLPFMSGFLGSCERVSMDWGTIKQLGHKRVRLITLFFTTIVLFVPAVISFLVFETEEDSVAFGNLAWPLLNTVVFGVLLSENYSSDVKLVSSKDTRREFLVTFVCMLVLELFYFPELSLWGLLFCGLLLYVAVRDLSPWHSNDLGSGEESPELLSDMIMMPIRHILSERKSRKIALFLLINTGYMVVEFVAGFMSNSLGLISDACHMLFDCAALAIGLYASYISRLPANSHYNYGRGRFEVLSGYANAVFLVLVGALIVVESLERILDPQEISTSSLLVVSIGGLLVNVIGLIFFHEEHHHAHGGSGSCSHSHSHSHSHVHSHHHDHQHDLHCHGEHHHKGHGSTEEFISLSSDFQDNHSIQSSKHHGLVSQHDQHGHAHHHDHHDHNNHHHDHDDHTSHHDYHDHTSHHDYHDHTSHHDHHDHTSHHEHHDHTTHHDHHEHTNHHDHHQHTNHHEHTNLYEHGHYPERSDHQQCHHHHHHHDADHGSHETSESHNVASVHCKGVCSSTTNSASHQKQTLSKAKEHSHRHIDHNMEGIFLHVLADTMGSVGVVISTLLIKYKGWLVADPACSIFISVLIISSVIPLLRNSSEILLQRVPRVHEHELKDALTDVLKIKGVYSIQKFHAWSFTNTDVVGTLHLHVLTDSDKTSTKSQVSHLLHNAGIKDLTLQVECVR